MDNIRRIAISGLVAVKRDLTVGPQDRHSVVADLFQVLGLKRPLLEEKPVVGILNVRVGLEGVRRVLDHPRTRGAQV